jgi:hypothetical protein
VADQVDRRFRRQMVDERIQIAQVVGKPVAVGRCVVGLAETAPVGGDDAAFLCQRIHRELVGCAHVHPAVHHQQGRALRRGHRWLAPDVEVVFQAAQLDEAAAPGPTRDIGTGHAAL